LSTEGGDHGKPPPRPPPAWHLLEAASWQARVPPRRRKDSPPQHAPLELPSSARRRVDQLKRHLWSAADILRGSIDSSDYKNYIFGLLFLKRLSDVFEEEAEKLLAQGKPPEVAWEDRDSHHFCVPKRARWSQLQKVSTNIGGALNKACSALEEQNSNLDGILAGIDFNGERKLRDTKNRVEALKTGSESHAADLRGLLSIKLSLQPDPMGVDAGKDRSHAPLVRPHRDG